MDLRIFCLFSSVLSGGISLQQILMPGMNLLAFPDVSQHSDLKLIDLRNNSISNLTNNILIFNPLLDTVILQNNQLDTVSMLAFLGTRLRELDLSQNYLHVMPDFGVVESSLEVLNLSHNQIQRIPELSNYLLLDKLDLAYNNLSYLQIEDTLRFPNSLGYLNLSYNQISSYKINVGIAAAFLEIDMSGNPILQSLECSAFKNAAREIKITVDGECSQIPLGPGGESQGDTSFGWPHHGSRIINCILLVSLWCLNLRFKVKYVGTIFYGLQNIFKSCTM